jgi:molecular chaperone GrpE
LLFAELSILRNEVRIEARQFKTALDDMRALGQLLGEQNERLTRDLERAREAAASAQRQVERRLLLDMLDVRDRVDAAVSVFRAWRPSFLSRLATTETKIVRGMGEGIELTLQRLDDLLVERRVRPIEALGTRLDPNIMRAIGVESDPLRGVGEVLREVRRGYLREDDLLRPAEVIVNRLSG